MKLLSIEAAFLWAQQFAAREWRLLLPMALAFLALPALVADLVVPDAVWRAMLPGADPSVGPTAPGWVLALLLAVMLLKFVGDLAITALALLPGISVREAILLGARRMPVVIGAALLLGAAVLGGVLVVALGLGAARADRVTLQAVVTCAIWAVGIYLCLRLVALVPLLIERRLRPVAAIRASWTMGRGIFWRVLGGFGLYVAGGLIVLFALDRALGAVLLLLGGAAGVPELGAILGRVVFRVGTAVFAAGLQLLVVGYYRQLAAPAR